jgi:hypothetical protein
MVEVLGPVHRGCWWPVGLKLAYDQMAATVPEIMDGLMRLRPLRTKHKNTPVMFSCGPFQIHCLFGNPLTDSTERTNSLRKDNKSLHKQCKHING